MYVYRQLMLNPTKHVVLSQTLNHNIFVERDHLKMRFKNVLNQLSAHNKDRQKAKSIAFKNDILLPQGECVT
jgi:hypothetical protein